MLKATRPLKKASFVCFCFALSRIAFWIAVGVVAMLGATVASVFFSPMVPPQDQWKQQQIDAIADALQELLTNPRDPVEGAMEAIDAAIDSWLDYFEAEREKWFQLKTRLRR